MKQRGNTHSKQRHNKPRKFKRKNSGMGDAPGPQAALPNTFEYPRGVVTEGRTLKRHLLISRKKRRASTLGREIREAKE